MDDNSISETDGEDLNDTVDGESLIPRQAEDNSTPFSGPGDENKGEVDNDLTEESLDDAQPALDSAGDIDSTQAYNEGIIGAAEENFPPDSDVASYDPTKDQSKKD